MALSNENGNMVMPVSPMYGGGYGNGGFGGDWSSWIILLLLFGMFGGGWGGFGGFGMGGFGADMGILYPWMNQSNQISDGFRDQMLNGTINGIQNAVTTGFGDVQTALCSGFAGVNASITNAQMADLERSFASQTAQMQGMNALQGQLAQCCCDNKAGLADLRYTVATEACADRSAVNDALRDVIAANNASTQRILDQMCNDKIDAKNEKIAELQNQLNMATLRESQVAQNAFIQQGLTNEVDALYNRLSNCPVPTTPVYGRTPIFTCNGNNGCGCSGNAFYN